MNNGVICSNCNTENAFGAKFCVHCGRSIRTPSVRICPECKSENAGSNSDCWQCGALLPKLTGGLGNSAAFMGIPSQEPDDEAPAASSDQDSPEEVDWSAIGQQEQASYDSNFPDWLIDSDGLQPADESPEPIITEAFPELVDESDPDLTGFEERDDADLPEWIDATSQGDAEPETPAEKADIGDALADWLAELGEPSDLDFTETSSAESGSPTSAQPGKPKQDPLEWLSEFGSLSTDILSQPISDQPEPEEEDDDDSLESWMSRIGHAETDFLSDPSESVQKGGDEPVKETFSEPPNWAVELGLTETGGFSIHEVSETVPDEDDEGAVLPPWLEDNDKTSILPELAELRDSQLDEEEADDEADLPDWLKDAEEIEDETRMTGYLPSEPKFDLDADDDEELPDWLDGIDEQELIEDAPAAARRTRTLSPKGVLSETDEDEQDIPTPGGGVTLPPWINTEDRADEDESELAFSGAYSMSDANLPPWLTGSEEDEPEPTSGGEPPTGLPYDSLQTASSDDDAGTAADDPLPNWVNDFDEMELPDEEEAQAEDAAAEASRSEEDMPEWLTEPGLFEIDQDKRPPVVETTIDADAELPDWLISSHDELETAQETEPDEPDFTVDLEEAAIPDWLTEPDFDSAGQAEADAGQAADFDFSAEEELPDWMLNEGAQDGGTDEPVLEQMPPAFGEMDEAPPDRVTPPADDDQLPDGMDDQTADSIESDWLMAFEDTDGDSDDDEGITSEKLSDWMTAESPLESQGDEQETIESELDSDWLKPEPVESDGMSQLLDESITDDGASQSEADLAGSGMVVDVDDLTITQLDTDFGFTAWLSDLGDDEAEEETIRGTALLDDLLISDPNIIKSELGWLEEVKDDGPPMEESTHGVAPLLGDEFISDALGLADADDEAPVTEQPEWLTAWESSGGEMLEPVEDEEIPELEEDIFAKLEQSVGLEPASVEVEEPPVEAEPAAVQPDFADQDDDWLIDGMLSSDGLEPAEIPDWLEQMEPVGDPDGVPTPKPDMAEPSADLPDWIADLKPSRDADMGSILPSALPLSDEEGALADISEDMAAEQLPQWLHSSDPAAQGEDAPTLPFAAEREEQTGWREVIFQDSDAGTDDWEEILGDLPPSVSPAEALAQADIPDWVQQLMPPVLKGEPEAVEEAAAEETGPLAGLTGVIGAAAIHAAVHSTEPLDPFKISKEQQQQAALLRQLTRAERQPAHVDLGTIHTTSTWTRIILAGVLFIAVAAGLLLPDLLKIRPPSAEVAPVQTLIEAAAGKPVLVAIEYTPAMAGELSPQASVILAQLQANGSPIATVSQYSTGMALAEELSAGLDVNPVGLITGEAIGLRQLGDCLGQDAQCQRILGRSLDAALQDQLKEVELIILFTSDHDSLVNWIEQVGSSSDVPIIAGITQSLMPTAAPYLESDQLQGAISSIYQTAALQEAAGENSLSHRVQAVGFGQLTAALLLLIGGIFMGSSGKKNRNSRNTKSSA